MSELISRAYFGSIRHRRFGLKQNHFNYKLYMLGLDVDEVENGQVNSWCIGQQWFKPIRVNLGDYIEGNAASIKKRIADKVTHLNGCNSFERVLMVVQARCFGLYFSPANFFYLIDKKGVCTQVLVEVTNTPWKQKHYYLVNLEKKLINEKTFHVSPFMDLDMEYHWKLHDPMSSNHLNVHIENHRKNGDKVFDATLAMKRRSITGKSMLMIWLSLPFMTLKIVMGIYYQAMKLWGKGVKFIPYQTKPNNKSAALDTTFKTK